MNIENVAAGISRTAGTLFRRTYSLSGSTPRMSALAGSGEVIDGHALAVWAAIFAALCC